MAIRLLRLFLLKAFVVFFIWITLCELEALSLAERQETDAAIWRRPLAARCVSCDKKVDLKGRPDAGSIFGLIETSPYPVQQS